jgi:hypothetical protein
LGRRHDFEQFEHTPTLLDSISFASGMTRLSICIAGQFGALSSLFPLFLNLLHDIIQVSYIYTRSGSLSARCTTTDTISGACFLQPFVFQTRILYYISRTDLKQGGHFSFLVNIRRWPGRAFGGLSCHDGSVPSLGHKD